MFDLAIVVVFLAVMLAPWLYAAQRLARVTLPVWTLPFVAIALGTLLQAMFGKDATFHIGYYGAIVFGIGLMAAATAYFSGRGK